MYTAMTTPYLHAPPPQMYPGWSARDNYAIHKKRRKRKTKTEGKGSDEGTGGLLGQVSLAQALSLSVLPC